MKTVIVFDTDDREGMKNTLKIVNYLAKRYLVNHSVDGKSFGKIQFIKTLRIFAKEAESSEVDGGSLRFAKRFADKVWNEELDEDR